MHDKLLNKLLVCQIRPPVLQTLICQLTNIYFQCVNFHFWLITAFCEQSFTTFVGFNTLICERR